MDLRQLEFFLKVAQEQSFTGASKLLHISQPTISKTIKSLEDELGAILFIRDNKQILLTDIGKSLFERVISIVGDLNSLTKEISLVTELKKGEIFIGIPPIIGVSFFPDLIGAFKDEYPNIEIQLLEVGTKEIEKEIVLGTLDIGIICNISNNKNQIEQKLLTKDPIQLILSKDHPLSEKGFISFSELSNEKFILFSSNFSLYDKIINCCKETGYSPYILCESSQRDFILEMVRVTNGIAFLPQRSCNSIDPNLYSVHNLSDHNLLLELSLIWKKDVYISFATKVFIEFVNQRF